MPTTCINPACSKGTNNKDGICAGCHIDMSWMEKEAQKTAPSRNIVTVTQLPAETQNEKEIVEVIENMGKKLCSCGCGKQSIKDGLAWGCYTKKYGMQPYASSKKVASEKPKEERGKRKEERGKRKEERGKRKEDSYYPGEFFGCSRQGRQ